MAFNGYQSWIHFRCSMDMSSGSNGCPMDPSAWIRWTQSTNLVWRVKISLVDPMDIANDVQWIQWIHWTQWIYWTKTPNWCSLAELGLVIVSIGSTQMDPLDICWIHWIHWTMDILSIEYRKWINGSIWSIKHHWQLYRWASCPMAVHWTWWILWIHWTTLTTLVTLLHYYQTQSVKVITCYGEI